MTKSTFSMSIPRDIESEQISKSIFPFLKSRKTPFLCVWLSVDENSAASISHSFINKDNLVIQSS